MITLSIKTAKAEDYQFIPANNTNILNTIIDLNSNSKLEIEIFGYAETFTKDNDTELIEEVLKVRERYLDAGIDDIRITIGLGNKGGMMETKFEFKDYGVYIRLSQKEWDES